MLSPFLVCLTEQLDKRGYGAKRQAEIVDRFNGLREQYARNGAVDPDTQAMTRVLDEQDAATRTKNRLAFDALLKRAQLEKHFHEFNYNKSIAGDGKTADPGVAAVALLSPDSRSANGNLNVDTLQQLYKGQIWAVMNDVLETIGKGAFGRQKGKGHMDDLVDEIFGKATGDTAAAQMAKAWKKGTDTLVDLFNSVGGALNKLDGWGLPQNQSLAKVIKAGGKGGDAWKADHMNWLAWDKMTWPNGAPIEAAERPRVLDAIYETVSSDGGNKIDPKNFRSQGAAIGNLLEHQRFMVFKDGEAWRAMHEKYGDGNVFDVMANYVDQMAHKMALVRVFGANVESGMDLVKGMALKWAADAKDGRPNLRGETQATLARYDLLAEQALRRNSMDPESFGANVVNATSNLLNSAQLAGAVLAAIPGDFATTMVMRAANHMPVLDGLVGPYVRGLVKPAEAVKLAAEAGFIMDSVVHTIYTKTRFTGMAEYGPAWTKRVSDLVMRASGMNVHTDMARWSNQQHIMGMMARDAGKAFDDLPWKPMAEKYGITQYMWDAMRSVAPYSPRANVEFLRPVDALTAKKGQDIYERFQSMVLQESRNMVLDTNPEANTMLKGNLRPDTMPGAVLHSFAMYKNFPIGLALTYGRVAMSMEGRPGRLSFIAGLGTSLLLAGAVGIQLREVSKGRDALAMNTPSFWGKAMLASGAMSIWGDFLFNGVNKQGGPTSMIAGPVGAFAEDTTQLAFGDMFDWADNVGSLKAEKNSKTPWAAKAVEFASRYQPGSSLWYARLALQRAVYDPLRMLSDPRGAIKMDRKERQRVKDFGNESWWEPGATSPARLPGVGAAP